MYVELTNKHTVTQILKDRGLTAKKYHSQHFLVDSLDLDMIIEATDLTADSAVLEIGPGLGVLTQRLAEVAGKVVSVEKDAAMVSLARQHTAQYDNVTIVHGDILDMPNSQLAELLGAKQYVVVANVPYLITNVLFRKFLTQSPKPQALTWLVQKEVAQRAAAPVGKMSLLAVSVQLYGQPEVIGIVPADHFVPAPKVDSAVISVKNIQEYSDIDAATGVDEKALWRMIKIGFAAPRKTLVNNLSAGLQLPKSEVTDSLQQLEILPTARPQELAVEQWIALVKNL